MAYKLNDFENHMTFIEYEASLVTKILFLHNEPLSIRQLFQLAAHHCFLQEKFQFPWRLLQNEPFWKVGLRL